MAQNIDLLGAVYPDVPAVNLPKQGGGTASFTDVSDTTAAASDVSVGKYFYTSAGVRTQGTNQGGGGGSAIIYDETDSHGGTIRHIITTDVIEGTKSITTNGTHDVGEYAYAEVNVLPSPGTAGTPVATKGAVSDHSVSVTPSVTNTTGYITGGTITGTAVTVSASELVSGSLSISTNGTADVTNYASVNVSVGGISIEELNVTTNGTYTAPTGKAYSPVNVSVQSVTAYEDDVTFYDYDGSIVASYSKADFLNLSALPSNPSHIGLTAQGWNWTLSDAKTYVTAYGKLDIGQSYTTTSGRTELDLNITDECLRLSVDFQIAINGTVTIYWGDGTNDTATGSDLTTRVATSHTYSTTGLYEISVAPSSGSTYAFVGQIFVSNVHRVQVKNIRFGTGATLGSNAVDNIYNIRTVTIPTSVTSIGSYAFRNCYKLAALIIPSGVTAVSARMCNSCYGIKKVVMPLSVTSIGEYAFYQSQNLSFVAIPSGLTSFGQYSFYGTGIESVLIPGTATSIGTNLFYYDYSLTKVTIESGMSTLGSYMFYGCKGLTKLVIPATVTTINANAFYDCSSMKEYHFLGTTVPSIQSTTFGTLPTDCIIYVPSARVSNYKQASNWSNYASQIVGE